MINLKHKNIKFSLASCWAELNVNQWESIINATTDSELVSACIIENAAVKDLGLKFIESLTPYLKWLSMPIDYSGWILKPEYKIDIKKETFGKLIMLREASGKKNRIRAAIELYYTLPVENLMLYDAVTISNDLYRQAEEINKMEERQLKHSPTNEQRRAGIDKFNQFGILNTIDSLAGGDILKYKEIYAMDYNTVFLKMKRSKIESEYNKNYSKIMSEKK